MRTEVTCALGLLAMPRGARAGAAGALGAVDAGGAPPPGAIPPAPAASAPVGLPASEHNDVAAAAAVRSVSRLCTPVLAKTFPSRQLLSPPELAASEVSRYDRQNRSRKGKLRRRSRALVSPSGSQRPSAPAPGGWRAGPAGRRLG